MVRPAASWPNTMLTVTRRSRMQGTPPMRVGSTVMRSKAMRDGPPLGPMQQWGRIRVERPVLGGVSASIEAAVDMPRRLGEELLWVACCGWRL